MADPDPTRCGPGDTAAAAARINSYMWYIHVLVRVNTEERLRANTAPFLQLGRCDDLTDHLVLGHFDATLLARLAAGPPPIVEQAAGYARVLAGVPPCFRDEFCRRLYGLLFSKGIVEWPEGIDVPAEPTVAAAAAYGGAVVVEGAVELEDTCLDTHEHHQECDGHEGVSDVVGDAGTLVPDDDDDIHRVSTIDGSSEPEWLNSPGSSLWYTDSWRDTDMTTNAQQIKEMERAAHFGTVANPLPMNYFSNWAQSRNGYGPALSAVDVDDDEGQKQQQPSLIEPPAPPFPSPQLPTGKLQLPVVCDNRRMPPTPPAPRRQRQANQESGPVTRGGGVIRVRSHNSEEDDDREHLGLTGDGRPPVQAHQLTAERRSVGNEQQCVCRCGRLKTLTPVGEIVGMPAHRGQSTHIHVLRSSAGKSRGYAVGSE